jgi:hypothetical protein
MRTTVTLDDQLASRLRDEMEARGLSFRQTVEAVLEQGLANRSEAKKQNRFVVKPLPLGLKPGIDPARVRDIDTDLEVDSFHEKALRAKSLK